MLFAYFDGKKAQVANYTQYESEQKNVERNSNHRLASICEVSERSLNFQMYFSGDFFFSHSLKTMRKCDTNHETPIRSPTIFNILSILCH